MPRRLLSITSASRRSRGSSPLSGGPQARQIGARRSVGGKELVMSELIVLLSGLGMPESPRWHEGRLWFCNWIDRQVVAAGPDGTPEVMLERGPDSFPMGWSIDWLPDGRLLTTGARLERRERDRSMVTLAEQPANEIVVDARGNIYINGADFELGRRGDAQARLHQARHARRAAAPGRRRHAAPQRHGHHPGQPDADHRRVARRAAHRVRHRPRRRAVRPAGASPGTSARTASPWTPSVRSGPALSTTRLSASPRAARCCSASSWPGTGRRSR